MNKFLSLNIPNLLVQDDPWQRTTAREQSDLLYNLHMNGMKVARIYTLSFPSDPKDSSKHIIVHSGYGTSSCNWTLNTDLMLDFDSALSLANSFQVKLIIPIIDTYDWWGGIDAFTALYGKRFADFWTDEIVTTAFMSLINMILTRNNTITGVTYGLDPTIYAWETGNELPSPPASWTLTIAKLIKSLAPVAKVIDGSYGNWKEEVLNSALVDIVSSHYYPPTFASSSYLLAELVGIGITCGWVLGSTVLLVLVKFRPVYFKNICWPVWTFKRFTWPFKKPSWVSAKPSPQSEPTEIPMQTIPQDTSSTENLAPSSSLIHLPPTTPSLTSIPITPPPHPQIPPYISYLLLTSLLLSLLLLTFLILYPLLIRGLDFQTRITLDSQKAGTKPFLVGELGLAPLQTFTNAFKVLETPSNVIGMMVWALRGHADVSGFYTHPDAYHLPGFAATSTNGFRSDEVDVMRVVRTVARSLGGGNLTMRPANPKVVRRNGGVTWMGCAGCSRYDVVCGTGGVVDVADNFGREGLVVACVGTAQVIGYSEVGVFYSEVVVVI